tara:strand:+ start:690 stop:1115 length:426 start_codon:yes stop_codon:yes gene_type:complete
MSKVLGIDYGTKRVGLAETDDNQIIATRLTSIHAKDLIEYLISYFSKYEVDTIVVGMPVRLDGSATNSTESVNNFISHLKRKFSAKKVITIDERFTSKIASQAIANSGMNKKKRQNKELIDQISAVIILQDYLVMKEKGLI